MHLILDLPLLLLLSVTLVQRCSTKASITETCHEIDNNIDKNYLSVSSRIEQANKNAGKSNRGFTIVDGDIAVNTGLQNADQCTSTKCKWPRKSNGKVYVPYVLNWRYTHSEKHIIECGLKSFTNLTCIQFVPHNNEKDFIHIMPNKGCYSNVGRQGGEQTLSLKSSKCIDFGVVQHELLHALGFHHEHSRSDRDKHVKIHYENIEPEAEDNFQKYDTNNLNTSYDYNSVMHYARDAFSKNGKPTIVPIPRSDVSIGLAKEMSKNDILRVKRLYCH